MHKRWRLTTVQGTRVVGMRSILINISMNLPKKSPPNISPASIFLLATLTLQKASWSLQIFKDLKNFGNLLVRYYLFLSINIPIYPNSYVLPSDYNI